MGEPNTQSSGWKQGIFYCWNDLGTCCFVCWCSCCSTYATAEAMGENGYLCALAACCVPCISATVLRQMARVRYNIVGDFGGDVLCSFCCTSCVQCQTMVEVNERERESNNTSKQPEIVVEQPHTLANQPQNVAKNVSDQSHDTSKNPEDIKKPSQNENKDKPEEPQKVATQSQFVSKLPQAVPKQSQDAPKQEDVSEHVPSKNHDGVIEKPEGVRK